MTRVDGSRAPGRSRPARISSRRAADSHSYAGTDGSRGPRGRTWTPAYFTVSGVVGSGKMDLLGGPFLGQATRERCRRLGPEEGTNVTWCVKCEEAARRRISG